MHAAVFSASRLRPRPAPAVLAAGVRLALALGAAPVAAPFVAAQSVGETAGAPEGSTWTAVGGTALGAYAGGVMGTVGSLIPCTRTYEGPGCVRPVAIGGAAIGMIGGAGLGANDSGRLGDAAVAGLAGAAIGGAALLAVQPFLERWSWGDVAAGAAIGGAIGSSGTGAAIGLGAGALVGGAAWALLPSVDVMDAAAVTLVGLAAGSLAGWIVRGVDAGSSTVHRGAAAPAVVGFTIRTR
jgi:hypothetical protein